MKNLKNLILLCAFVLPGCNIKTETSHAPEINTTNVDFVQKFEFRADEKTITIEQADVVSMTYMAPTLMCSASGEKKDFQFLFQVYTSGLKPGTYMIYDCTNQTPSVCIKDADEHGKQEAFFGPHVKTPMPPNSAFRFAYNAPSLGLSPMSLTITSVTDEQQPGNPWSTKRLKGVFKGTLAYIEDQGEGKGWHIAGKTTVIEGSFDLFCNIR